MAYISKNNILAAYKKLCQMHPDPNAQGATQKVSAIRHFIALDRFYKQYHKDCNTREKHDRDEFARLIGIVSDVCPNLYTTNFYYPLRLHTGDYCVGSNFYSAGQVKVSLINPNRIFEYPKRGSAPLMKIQNDVLKRDTSLYHNFESYISSDYIVALVVWLMRQTSIEQNNGKSLLDNIYTSLSQLFTPELLNIIFEDPVEFEHELELYNLAFNDKPYSIEERDIEDMFDIFFPLIREIRQETILPSHQMIFYGAPGTGKSHKIKAILEQTDTPKENIFRTTFHPDSDYSTFVGAYKPTMQKRYRYDGKVKAKYYEDDDLAGKKKDEFMVDRTIEYRFVPQAFLNAYIQSYRTDKNVYLIIEEINRGNCAQIFGDLFQLLDRDENGVSEYTIKADADLRTFLEEKLGKDNAGIMDGELRLPSNLYIYATMNTSDQSLFPIDSAFKRRWDWEYEPIKYNNTDWVIDIQGSKFSWVSFQKEINSRIFEATNSEDKMLGDYFVNPADGVITAKILLNKILFYLWNDVCKDGEGDIFKTSDTDGLSFSELHGDSGIQKIIGMMDYLKVQKAE